MTWNFPHGTPCLVTAPSCSAPILTRSVPNEPSHSTTSTHFRLLYIVLTTSPGPHRSECRMFVSAPSQWSIYNGPSPQLKGHPWIRAPRTGSLVEVCAITDWPPHKNNTNFPSAQVPLTHCFISRPIPPCARTRTSEPILHPYRHYS